MHVRRRSAGYAALRLTAATVQSAWFFCDQLAGEARGAGHLDLARQLERETSFLYEVISKLPEHAAEMFENEEAEGAATAAEKEVLSEN